jgi:hypothetical protein
MAKNCEILPISTDWNPQTEKSSASYHYVVRWKISKLILQRIQRLGVVYIKSKVKLSRTHHAGAKGERK